MLDELELEYYTYLRACIAACNLRVLGALVADQCGTSLAKGDELKADKRVGNGGAASEGLG